MSNDDIVASHYSGGSVLEVIENGLAKLNKTPADVSTEDLGPVDEFHTGGRAATKALLDQLSLAPSDHVLDVGCGLGGSSRYTVTEYGCRVTGIDLTPEFIEAGRTLNQWVGLDQQIQLDVASATELPFATPTFNHAFMLHVGMNIADKSALMANVFRALEPGGSFAVYDMMRTGDAELELPVPWASDPAANAIAAPEIYREAFSEAGFDLVAERNRKDFAEEFFAKVKAQNADRGGPPALGIHLLMGPEAPVKVKNILQCMSAGGIAPFEMIGRKPI